MAAIPEAMVETLRRIPMTKDILDRINEHCEWINLIFQVSKLLVDLILFPCVAEKEENNKLIFPALTFFAQASKERVWGLQRGHPR